MPAPVEFTVAESTFKGGMFHGMIESTWAERSPAIYQLLKNDRVPLYAVRPPIDALNSYRKGAEVHFWIVLYGAACRSWVDALSPLLEPEALRLGRSRVAIEVSRVDAVHPARIPTVIYHGSNGMIDAPIPVTPASDDWRTLHDLSLKLVTPLLITSTAKRKLGLIDHSVGLYRWVRSLRERLLRLEPDLAPSFEFGSDKWVSAEHALKLAHATESSLRHVEWRYVPRNNTRPVMLDGVIGTIRFKYAFPPPVVALLKLGQWLGIGQGNTMGRGWYWVTNESRDRDSSIFPQVCGIEQPSMR
jgi:hypothetical protein